MPQLVIQTNLRLHQIPVDFNRKATELLARLQEKPPEMTLVSMQPGQLISIGSDREEPCALILVQSIGSISVEKNRLASIDLTELMERELGISPKRLFINFIDLNAENVAWNGKIFDDIFRDGDLEGSSAAEDVAPEAEAAAEPSTETAEPEAESAEPEAEPSDE